MKPPNMYNRLIHPVVEQNIKVDTITRQQVRIFTPMEWLVGGIVSYSQVVWAVHTKNLFVSETTLASK